ncbi:MAG: Uma2 family endonuclease [Cyclobacteriaceae bacterium]|nr:Uma2 family endonuclease [Cyclobacteriaceae bacterium]
MNVDIPAPPRTILEVYKMLPEGTLAELINGQLFMSPAPTNLHQRMVKRLLKIVDQFVEDKKLGEVFVSPSDLYLDEANTVVQPELYFISRSNRMVISETTPNRGVPDLIIEVLSSSNNKFDLQVKKDLYEKFGVREYWVIDPVDKKSLVYSLASGRFTLTSQQQGKISSILFNYQFEF